jgi:2-keto-4-pentenoate hydratase
VSDVVERLAAELRAAERDGMAVAPLTERHPELTVDDAYAIQRAVTSAGVEAGRRVVGRKVGLTSKAMQDQLGVDEPDFGTLFADMVVADRDTVAVDRLIQPRVEAEIAFVLGRDLRGPGVTLLDALGAIAWVAPSLEIIDSRVADWRIRLVDTIADNGSAGLAAVGSALTRPDDVDLRLTGVIVDRNGTTVEHGLGVAALGHPAACLAWLANKLAEFDEGLTAGDLVLPGSLHRAIDVAPGDVVTATFTHIGSITVRFAGPDDHATDQGDRP